MSKIKPTIEQVAAIDKALEGDSFKVMAFAGTGKTSSLTMIAREKKEKGLYLAFNKKMADEAAEKFPDHVECKTFHALAYRHMPRHIIKKVSNQRIYPRQIIEIYDLHPIRILSKDGVYDLSANGQANMILNTIKNFCKTSSKMLSERHLHQILEIEDKNIVDELTSILFPYIQKHWELLIGDNDFPIEHDIYLKLWEMSDPKLDYDYIFVDEAQDSDPTSVSIVLNQKDKQVIYTGDSYQSIYLWRGAKNVMEGLPLEALYLTQSFRFGDAVADTANLILKRVFGEKKSIKGNKRLNSKVHYSFIGDPNIDAYITRTNQSGFAKYLTDIYDHKKVDILADKTRILEFLRSAEELKLGVRPKYGELKGFYSWEEVIEHVKANEDTQLGTMIRLSNNYTYAEVQASLLKSKAITCPDRTVLTAHKAKGLEYDNVELGDDFHYHIKEETLEISAEESRLLYVAVTRAKHNLYAHKISNFLVALQKGYKIKLTR